MINNTVAHLPRGYRLVFCRARSRACIGNGAIDGEVKENSG